MIGVSLGSCCDVMCGVIRCDDASGVYAVRVPRSPAGGTSTRPVLCRYVLCVEHDLHMLPYINLSTRRISMLVAKCAAEVDLWANMRSLRSSMVINHTLGSLNGGVPLDQLVTQHAGGWIFGPSGANISHYFSSQGAAGGLGQMVRPCAAEQGWADPEILLSAFWGYGPEFPGF